MMFGRGYFDRDRFFMHRDFYGITLWHVLIAIGVIILIVAIVVLLSRKSGNNERKGTNENLRRILDEKYVRGEISEEEYKTKRKFLDEN